MGLFIRDEWERSMKNQASKDELVEFVTISWVAYEKQPVKRPRVEYMIGRWRVVSSCQFREYFARRANPRSTCETLAHLFPIRWKVMPGCQYPHYLWIVSSSFQRENSSKYTWELEVVIPTIIYTFFCGFSQLLPFHL